MTLILYFTLVLELNNTQPLITASINFIHLSSREFKAPKAPSAPREQQAAGVRREPLVCRAPLARRAPSETQGRRAFRASAERRGARERSVSFEWRLYFYVIYSSLINFQLSVIL